MIAKKENKDKISDKKKNTPTGAIEKEKRDGHIVPKPITNKRIANLIEQSNYISRDLSWMLFNRRVLDQARIPKRNIYDQLKFLAITASNLDEFFMIRVGSLYNYIDYGKERIDYSGLREKPFKKLLFEEIQDFTQAQHAHFKEVLKPKFKENGFQILGIEGLTDAEKDEAAVYFMRTIFPMLTPMVYDNYRTFPVLMNKVLTFGVVTRNLQSTDKDERRFSFVQVPQNLPRFYEFEREDDEIIFVPIERIIHWQINKLYRNIDIVSVSLFRVTRNGDISLEESDDIEADFIDEIKQKIKTRKTGRVVRIEVEKGYSTWLMKNLKRRWQLDDDNVFVNDTLMDYTSLFSIAGHENFKDKYPPIHSPILPIGLIDPDVDYFEHLKESDILLHHPYHSIEPLLHILEDAAEDPDVLAIKITIYRLAKHSRVTSALQKAAENGKHVSVLFELKARFDEENNIREAERLQKAGCYVIHGIGRYKTHTKMLLIVRKEEQSVTRYVHLASGNYNESTSRLYTDIGMLTTNETYAHDVSEFFNVITGHSQPHHYEYLLTAPRDLRNELIKLIQNEAKNAQKGLTSGIVMKMNSLEDKRMIDELYAASKAGVQIKLIVRGICCIRPQRVGLSENIMVKSIVGDYLEHSRMFYFHNNGDPKIYGGSADSMVRSFDRRIESVFLMVDEGVKKQAMHILDYNLRDNMNSYMMQENGNFIKTKVSGDEEPFNLHEEFFEVNEQTILETKLF
ncbi:polyphosphate kinase 1 [uncultured Microscilla sp.]|uniref:polyphosphate kinase 1 n=1 Tax=uncultured Microscilla sp. TaxID=432653 RepID=UPI002606FFD7|nr:polyphosphate kinase 1 [uncultured Microscilla sp.]